MEWRVPKLSRCIRIQKKQVQTANFIFPDPNKRIRRFAFLYPTLLSESRRKTTSSDASCTTTSLVYVNISNNACLYRPAPVRRRKRMQRYGKNQYPPNILAIIFQKTRKFSRFFTKQRFYLFRTPNSLPTLINAAIHLSSCSRLCPAEI